MTDGTHSVSCLDFIQTAANHYMEFLFDASPPIFQSHRDDIMVVKELRPAFSVPSGRHYGSIHRDGIMVVKKLSPTYQTELITTSPCSA